MVSSSFLLLLVRHLLLVAMHLFLVANIVSSLHDFLPTDVQINRIIPVHTYPTTEQKFQKRGDCFKGLAGRFDCKIPYFLHPLELWQLRTSRLWAKSIIPLPKTPNAKRVCNNPSARPPDSQTHEPPQESKEATRSKDAIRGSWHRY